MLKPHIRIPSLSPSLMLNIFVHLTAQISFYSIAFYLNDDA